MERNKGTSNSTEKLKIKRYTLVIPEKLFKQVEEVADSEDTTVVAVLRKFITLGLEFEKIQSKGGVLVKRENGKDTELLIIS